MKLCLVWLQIVTYLLDLPEKDEEEVERAQINNFDTLWGETGILPPEFHLMDRNLPVSHSLVTI